MGFQPNIPQLAKLVEQARPAEPAWLLLRVILGNDADAVTAWRAWKTGGMSEETGPTETRLLPSAAQRLKELGVAGSSAGVIADARRDTFMANRVRLNAVRPLLNELSAAMQVMLLKGGARIAASPKDEHLRVIRDIDLLFKPEDLPRALEIAIAAGYRSVSGLLPGPVKSRALAPVFAAGEGKVDNFEVDFHAVPLRLGRTGFHDTELWQRAVDGHLLGKAVKIPSPSDRFVQAIAHGLVADNDKPVDWIVDAVVVLRHPQFDSQVVVREIRRRRLGLPVAVAAKLLDELGVTVPERIVAACAGDLSNPLYRREFAATLKPTRAQSLADRGFVYASELYRSFGVRAHITSWKTSWLAVPSLHPKGEDWCGFVGGRATLTVGGIGGNRVTVRFSSHPCEQKRPSFDIFMDDIWIGRVRFRWPHRFATRWPRSWRARITFCLPAGTARRNPRQFTIVALDEQKMPSIDSGHGVSVAIEKARR